MRLIDADALPISVAWDIKDAPTVDAVEVVRCKDCKYWNGETNGCARNPCVVALRKNDFCSYGERVKRNESFVRK